MEEAAPISFRRLAFQTIVVHTVTYFLVGFLAYTAFDYGRHFASPEIRVLMRQTDDPWVMAGPMLQPLRGLLFAIAFYPLRGVLFGARGWLHTWVMLVVIGILSTFGPAPGSVEGLIYTRIAPGYQLGGMIEVLLQSFLLSYLLWLWVRHPEAKVLPRVAVAAFVLAVGLPALGLVTTRLGPTSLSPTSLARPAHAASLSASTISYLKPAGHRTQLVVLDPILRTKQVLASFDAPNDSKDVSWSVTWSPGGKMALVGYSRWTNGGPFLAKLWRVEVASRKVSLLPAPPTGKLGAVTQTLEGLWVEDSGEAVVETHASREGGWPGRTIRFEGQRYPVWQEGRMLTGKTDQGDDYNNRLCHAWALRGSTWKRLDTLAYRDYDLAGLPIRDHAPSVSRYQKTMPSFFLYAAPSMVGKANPPQVGIEKDPRVLRALGAVTSGPGQAPEQETWLRAGPPDRRVYLRVQMATEVPFFTSPVVRAREGVMGPVIGNEESLVAALRDRYLLLRGERRAWLLDVMDPSFLFQVDACENVVFVPLPKP